MPTTDAPMETGIFYNRNDAEEAVRLLHELGYRDDEISVMMSDDTRAREFAAETGSKVPEGAGAGVMIGGALGGIVAAATTTIAGAIVTGGIVLPLIAGPLTTILAGMGAGGLVGGIIGALVGAGIPEERARAIDAGLEQGGIMVGVSPRDRRRVSEIPSTPVDRLVSGHHSRRLSRYDAANGANIALRSAYFAALSANVNVPWSRISCAARKKAPSAARDRALPTLTRLTPISDNSSKVSAEPARPMMTLTGRSTERTTSMISCLLVKPGAYNTSAPAS